MATLPGQRATFTLALKQYNTAEDDETREGFAKHMARVIQRAPQLGFTVEQVTQNQSYPQEVTQHLEDLSIVSVADDESQALSAIQDSVDVSNVVRVGDGAETVYAYGYHCIPDRLKIGRTNKDTISRIIEQISSSTPDKPVLFLEIKTHRSKSLEAHSMPF